MIHPGKQLFSRKSSKHPRLASVSMVILTDNRPEPYYQPTGHNMLAAFHWLVTDNHPGDSLFLHYSGHGGCRLYL